jgi:hypothetical protein
MSFGAVATMSGCHHPSARAANTIALAACLARAPSSSAVDSTRQRLRIGEDNRFRAGDRVVIVIDDTARGVAIVPANASTGIQVDAVPGLAWLKPEQVAEITVMKGMEAHSLAAPCEVEGGLIIRTTRSR